MIQRSELIRYLGDGRSQNQLVQCEEKDTDADTDEDEGEAESTERDGDFLPRRFLCVGVCGGVGTAFKLMCALRRGYVSDMFVKLVQTTRLTTVARRFRERLVMPERVRRSV